MRVGVPYYFEQWPVERWQTDARLMQEAGIDAVRMAEFAWSTLEPREGALDFSLLDSAIALFTDHGMSVILGTPTATYPPWLHAKHPDIHQVASNGRVKEYGQRQDACKNNPGYRSAAMSIVRGMADHYAGDRRIVAWQIDNELGGHGTESCWCAHCEQAFRAWLAKRFSGDVDALNGAWGTSFWSQTYGNFSEVSLPRDTADRAWKEGQNPGLLLAFRRFSSHVQVEFLAEQAAIIRAACPGARVTHNFQGGYDGIDCFDLARHLDVVSWDNYPFFELNGKDGVPSGFPHALMRGLRRSSAWVIEQACGAGGWDRAWPSPAPGQVRAWALQSVARGADFLSFFRWRSSRYGTEQFWHGILAHDGIPAARYREIARVAGDLAKVVPDVEGCAVNARVAILMDFDSLSALDLQPQSHEGLDYRRLAAGFAGLLDARGIDYDCVGSVVDAAGYDVLLVPSLFVCDESQARLLEDFVSGGGLLVLGPRSGLKDKENAVTELPLPGLLARVAGCRVEDFDAFSSVPGLAMTVALANGRHVPAHSLAEVLAPGKDAEVIASYADRYYSGKAAATLHTLGNGACVYLGTELRGDGLARLLLPLLERRGLGGWDLPEGLETTVRQGSRGRFRFYINHRASPVTFHAIRPGSEILDGARVEGQLSIEAFGARVVRED